MTILTIRNNKMIFYDHSGNSIQGTKEIRCAFTIKAGETVYQDFKTTYLAKSKK